ncbi:MAG: hypothetical protein LH605_08615 [Microbacteriaceae bacterium]|nr:hypothetical protein [Microbacteriaceae bacterium]
MSTGGATRQRLERARAVSALIGADAAARDAFEQAYTGRGDATGSLAALLSGRAANPGRDASLDRHRRSAFARPHGPADEAAAAVALLALRREVESADADSAALDRALAVVLDLHAERRAADAAAARDSTAAAAEDGSTADAPTSPAVAPESRPFPRWVRPALAVVVIVAAIAVGAGADNLITGARPGTAPVDAGPSPITYFRDPAVRDGEATGDIEPADRWFRGEQTAEDAYPLAFEGIDLGSTRLVHTGIDGIRVWVGRTRNADYCLLSYSVQDGAGGSSCMGAEDFAQAGVMMGTGNITVTWTGAELTVQISRP